MTKMTMMMTRVTGEAAAMRVAQFQSHYLSLRLKYRKWMEQGVCVRASVCCQAHLFEQLYVLLIGACVSR